MTDESKRRVESGARRQARANPAIEAFSLALSELHFQAGRPSFRGIGRAIGCSHTTVSKIFAANVLPSWEIVHLVVKHLDGDESQFRALWYRAARATSPSFAGAYTAPSRFPVTAFALLCAGIGAVLLLLMMAQGARPEAAATNQWITDLSQIVFGALAACSFSVTAARSVGRQRQWRYLLAIGIASWTAGHILWTWARDISAVNIPFPAPSDVGYLALAGFGIPAMCTLLVDVQRRDANLHMEWWAISREACTLSLSLVGVVWFVVPAFQSSIRQLDALSIFVGSIYIFTDAVLVFLSSLACGAARSNLTLIITCAGFSALLLSDSFFTATLLAGDDKIPFGADFGFIAAPALLLLAAWAPEIELEGSEADYSGRWLKIRKLLGIIFTTTGVVAYLTAIFLGFPQMMGIPPAVYVAGALALVAMFSVGRLRPVRSQ